MTYIRNEDILCEIYKMKSTGVISNGLGRQIMLIADNLARLGCFQGYTWKDEMISQGVETCIRYLHNFEPIRSKRPSPFNYITTLIRNSFLNTIKYNNKHCGIKKELNDKMNFETQCRWEAGGTFDYTLLADQNTDYRKHKPHKKHIHKKNPTR